MLPSTFWSLATGRSPSSGLSKALAARERCDGYKNALVEYGVPVDANLVLSADYYQESGYAAMRRLLELDKKGVTAVFAASDLMALGAMKAVLDAGLRVPHDISVVGFDNIPNSDLFVVPLTTVAMPAREMGEIAAAKMIHLLERQAVEEKTELDVEQVRNSTAPPIGALGRGLSGQNLDFVGKSISDNSKEEYDETLSGSCHNVAGACTLLYRWFC